MADGQERCVHQVLFQSLGLPFPVRRSDRRSPPLESLQKTDIKRKSGRRDLVDLPFPTFPDNRTLRARHDQLTALSLQHTAQQATLASAQLQSFLLHTELLRSLQASQHVLGLTGVGIN